MTMVLRDSLGGNCRTVMVATISAQDSALEESISTCRFAQRVAMVRNEVGGLAAPGPPPLPLPPPWIRFPRRCQERRAAPPSLPARCCVPPVAR